ncbi:DUF4255 domain-containing protein [Rhodobacterales bacterium HKCCE3408]|nr:DUF4255 domain-containing protein [Rhodobacterales bacterium HKCCE3408]
MSIDALQATTRAIQRILFAALSDGGGALNIDTLVPIGPPPRAPDGARASLFLFHVEPNREVRNMPRMTRPVVTGDDGLPLPPDAQAAARPQDALALDVRYMVTVFRSGGADDGAADPHELLRLGQVMSALQAHPMLTGAILPGQEVRITPEPYAMEEMSRIWGLFPDQGYRTSVVYLAAPVFIDARDVLRGGPVVSRRLDAGTSAEAPDPFRLRAEEEV